MDSTDMVLIVGDCIVKIGMVRMLALGGNYEGVAECENCVVLLLPFWVVGKLLLREVEVEMMEFCKSLFRGCSCFLRGII